MQQTAQRLFCSTPGFSAQSTAVTSFTARRAAAAGALAIGSKAAFMLKGAGGASGLLKGAGVLAAAGACPALGFCQTPSVRLALDSGFVMAPLAPSVDAWV